MHATEKLRDTTGATVSAGGLVEGKKVAAVAKVSRGVTTSRGKQRHEKRKKGSCATNASYLGVEEKSRKVDSDTLAQVR